MAATRFESEIHSLKISRQLLIVLILLFVALIIWTFITIGASQNKTTLSDQLITLAKPLNPTIDREILQSLQLKEYIPPEEIGTFTIYKLVTLGSGTSHVVVPIDVVEIPRPTTQQNSNSNTTPSPTPELEPSSSPAI